MDSMENQKNDMTIRNDSRQVAEEAVKALFDKKGISIRLFRVEETTVIADYYVICTARASTHAYALADEVSLRLENLGLEKPRTEGRDGGEWLLVDLGTVLVHIFTKDAREYYNLERLLPADEEVDLTPLFEELKNQLKAKEVEE